MALGDTYNNNKKKQYSPTLYSAYGTSNAESKVDPTRLGYSFWNKLLKITIEPAKFDKEGNVTWDSDNSGSIYLTHLKAKIFRDQLEAFLKDPDTYNNMGVNSGQGLISISNGKEITGKSTPCLIIRSVDEEGKPQASFLYEFRSEFHYGVVNYEDKTAAFDKTYYNVLEIEMLMDLLDSYYRSMSGAVAYSVLEFGKYDASRVNTKLDSIAEKLGIEYKSKSGGGKTYQKSAFDKSEGRNYSNKSLDEIEDEM